MKRLSRIQANTILTATEIHPDFEDIEVVADRAGYIMTADEDYNIYLEAKYANTDYVPTIDVRTVEETNGVYHYIPVITFPVLDASEFSASDAISYWIQSWYRDLSPLIKDLVDFELDPTNS